MSKLNLSSTFTLVSGKLANDAVESTRGLITRPVGHKMPILGLGVWQMPGQACATSCKAALDAGYRFVYDIAFRIEWALIGVRVRHIDSAIVYRNETEVGKVVRECGLKREELFISTYLPTRPDIGTCRSWVRLVSVDSLEDHQSLSRLRKGPDFH